MKKLTALVTASVILFSLSGAAWAEGEGSAPAYEPATVVLTEAGGASVNPEGSDMEENPAGAVLERNEGGIDTNNGTVNLNAPGGTIETNKGTVQDNYGNINTNDRGATVTANAGTVQINQGTVKTNDGTIGLNAGTAELNYGEIKDNLQKVTLNFGTVTNGSRGHREVLFNADEVICAGSTDEVKYNAGVVKMDYANGDSYDQVICYGVVYANETGDNRYLPKTVLNQLQATPQDANGILRWDGLAFREAESDSGKPEKDGSIILLSAAELGFEKAGYTLGGWLDAMHGNAEYAVGETVTVTAPLWLIPNWVLAPLPAEPGEPEAAESGAGPAYILVPAATEPTESFDLFNVSVRSEDPRVTQDSVLPAAALRVSAELAEDLRSGTLKVDFDGEILPSDSYSLNFHSDGTVTILFSRSFISTLAVGEHEIILCLQDAEIYVTLVLTEPAPEETSLRARKAQLSGAFTNMPQSSAAGQKGKSG